MGNEILTFGNNVRHFTVIRLLFFWGDVDIEKVLVSKKISFGGKSYRLLA